MICKNCKCNIIDKNIQYKTGRIAKVYILCDNCKYGEEFIIYEKINENKTFELHLPGYNYCGPGTRVINRLNKKIKPVNRVDKACMKHDINYLLSNNTDIKTISESDKEFLDELLTIKKPDFLELVGLLVILPCINIKMTIDYILNFYK